MKLKKTNNNQITKLNNESKLVSQNSAGDLPRRRITSC